jgi:uncharacterized protein YdeI (BOF family)
MKKVLTVIAGTFFVMPTVFAGEITSKITDSVQLNVQGAAIQSTRIGESYSASGSNITATTLGGVGVAGSYGVKTDGQSFSFSETSNAADVAVTTQTWSGGGISSPNLYGDYTIQLAGDKGSLAGTLSPTGISTITAGGPGTTGTAQRSVELSVFK